MSAENTPSEGPRTAYVSTGDCQSHVDMPFMDSEATIEGAFELMKANFNVDRIFWRGGQDEIWLRDFVFRYDNRYRGHKWKWYEHLIGQGRTNEIAMRAARGLGLSIWLTEALFDHASDPSVEDPELLEDRVRIEHPEWASTNRYGTRRGNGPLAFCYPAARQAMVDRYATFLVDQDYDGIHFYTYTENWGIRYDDEFGYDPPVVDEFKRRYGVDILKEEFDRDAWARLKGEHVTQFLRELREALRPHGKEIAVFIDLGDSHLTQQWDGVNRTSGRIHMDWETWAREGIVDELVLNPRAESEEVRRQEARRVIDGVSGTGCAVTFGGGQSDPYMPLMAGVDRRLLSSRITETVALESSFGYEHGVGSSDEILPPEPPDTLAGDEREAKRRLLYRVFRGHQTVPVDDIVAATRDDDIFVRRMALRALGVMRDPQAVPAIEAALSDRENAVRCQAVLTLGEVSGPNSLDRMFDAVGREPMNVQVRCTGGRSIIAKLGAQNVAGVFARVSDPVPSTRWAAIQGLIDIASTDFLGGRSVLVEAATGDPDPYARELALEALMEYPDDPEAVATVVRALQAEEDAVQAHTAQALTDKVVSGGGHWREGLAALTTLFREYGDGCSRSDAEWGWRFVSEAIVAFGQEGRDALEGFIAQKDDRRLAEVAWRTAYIPHGRRERFGVTPEEDREAHSHHPFLDLPL